MNDKTTQQLITKELRLRRRNLRNKIIVGSFLAVIMLTILTRITTSFLEDCGLFHGKFHVGYKDDPMAAFSNDYALWLNNMFHGLAYGGGTIDNTDFIKAMNDAHVVIPTDWTNDAAVISAFNGQDLHNFWYDFINDPENISIRDFTAHTPNFLWNFTQFTWLTTFTIALFFTFRLFKYDDYVPHWLRWVMKQKTLSLMAMYDTVVGAMFWGAMASSIVTDLQGDLFWPNMIDTVFVHGVIPIGLDIYYFIYVSTSKKASRLNETFALKGIILPSLYVVYYILMTIVWTDPYGVTNMHEVLTMDPVSHYSYAHLGLDQDWGAWASQLFMAPLAIIGIYIILGMVTVLHNFLLYKVNKNYDPAHDHDAIKAKQYKLEKIAKKMIKKETKLHKELLDK